MEMKSVSEYVFYTCGQHRLPNKKIMAWSRQRSEKTMIFHRYDLTDLKAVESGFELSFSLKFHVYFLDIPRGQVFRFCQDCFFACFGRRS